jgi:hypothetical protein
LPSDDVIADGSGKLQPTLTCPTCGYRLDGLRDDRCPECGKAFDRAALIAAIGRRNQAITLAELCYRFNLVALMVSLVLALWLIGPPSDIYFLIVLVSLVFPYATAILMTWIVQQALGAVVVMMITSGIMAALAAWVYVWLFAIATDPLSGLALIALPWYQGAVVVIGAPIAAIWWFRSPHRQTGSGQ